MPGGLLLQDFWILSRRNPHGQLGYGKLQALARISHPAELSFADEAGFWAGSARGRDEPWHRGRAKGQLRTMNVSAVGLGFWRVCGSRRGGACQAGEPRALARHRSGFNEVTRKRGLASPFVHSALPITRRRRDHESFIDQRKSR